jgi:glycosyltransferase involved in cell wall biosynthesis
VDKVATWTGPETALFHGAFESPELAILLSPLNPPDGEVVRAKKQVVIPYGIPDVAPSFKGESRSSGPPVILSVGVLSESKGTMLLLEACRHLMAQGLAFSLRLVGAFVSQAFEDVVRRYVADAELGSFVEILGVKSGDAKWVEFHNADIFCFPTMYELETFGVVALEAMQFAKPVVASSWRALPSIVRNGETGLLFPPGNATALASALRELLVDADLRIRMGRAGRERYCREYTIQQWYQRMEDAICDAAGDP